MRQLILPQSVTGKWGKWGKAGNPHFSRVKWLRGKDLEKWGSVPGGKSGQNEHSPLSGEAPEASPERTVTHKGQHETS